MNFKIENIIIGLSETLPENLNLICEIEKQRGNREFINPYDKKRHQQVIDSKDEEHLSIWNKDNKELIGFVILAGLANPNLSLELRRIVVQPKGKGYGRQCLQLVKQYSFQTIKFHRLWLDVFEDNQRAIHVYKSEGFKEEGKLRDAIKSDEGFRTLIILSILENEYDK